MCWMCDHPEATFADYVDDLLQPVIDRCGWAVQGVGGSKVRAPFSYTVGLTLRRLPELVVTGKPQVEAGQILNDMAREVLARRPQAGERRVQAVQLVWADDRGRWPREVGHRGPQPVLGPRARPVRRAG